MPNGRTHTKTRNSFKNINLKGILAGLFDGELELKGNNFTNASINCFHYNFAGNETIKARSGVR